MAGESVGDDEEIITAGNRRGRRLPDLVVDGLDEHEIFSFAPVMRCDRIYWGTSDPIDLRALLSDLGPQAWTRQWSDGLCRVWVPEGNGEHARERIRAWCEERDIEPVNLRVESGVAFRDLDLIPSGLLPALIAACVDWLYPHTSSIQRRLVAELPGVDDDDVRGMMYLFVHDLADRFDSDRQGRNGALNFTAFALGKIRTWPQDAARSVHGRVLANDRAALGKLAAAIAAQEGRAATEAERAEALGVGITELRKREEAVQGLMRLRHMDPILEPDDVQMASSTDRDVADEALDAILRSDLTRELLRAVDPGDGRADPLGLAAVYLGFWEGLGRSEIADELGVSPKTVSSAMARTLRDIDASRFA
ncbi:MAG: hypothetical protein RL134_1021 [Actinomycetota bacterium]|jgi:DNA-directed RNA polymerase specialized sigma subunit